MIWFLTVPAMFVLTFREFVIKDPYHQSAFDVIMGTFMSLFLSVLIGGLPAAGLALFIGSQIHARPVLSRTDTLVSLHTKDGVQGTFYLGSGSINGSQYYFFYRKNGDGSFVPGRVYADDAVRVYEETRTDASMLTYDWVKGSDEVNLFSFPVNAGGHSYDFHVPTGTILRGFSM